MINRLIEFSLKNRGLILLAYALLAVWGYWTLLRSPIDAIPDLSENQVIVYTDWAGYARARDLPVALPQHPHRHAAIAAGGRGIVQRSA
jgi:Cu/Ag efflux pump CusA